MLKKLFYKRFQNVWLTFFYRCYCHFSKQIS